MEKEDSTEDMELAAVAAGAGAKDHGSRISNPPPVQRVEKSTLEEFFAKSTNTGSGSKPFASIGGGASIASISSVTSNKSSLIRQRLAELQEQQQQQKKKQKNEDASITEKDFIDIDLIRRQYIEACEELNKQLGRHYLPDHRQPDYHHQQASKSLNTADAACQFHDYSHVLHHTLVKTKSLPDKMLCTEYSESEYDTETEDEQEPIAVYLDNGSTSSTSSRSSYFSTDLLGLQHVITPQRRTRSCSPADLARSLIRSTDDNIDSDECKDTAKPVDLVQSHSLTRGGWKIFKGDARGRQRKEVDAKAKVFGSSTSAITRGANVHVSEQVSAWEKYREAVGVTDAYCLNPTANTANCDIAKDNRFCKWIKEQQHMKNSARYDERKEGEEKVADVADIQEKEMLLQKFYKQEETKTSNSMLSSSLQPMMVLSTLTFDLETKDARFGSRGCSKLLPTPDWGSDSTDQRTNAMAKAIYTYCADPCGFLCCVLD